MYQEKKKEIVCRVVSRHSLSPVPQSKNCTTPASYFSRPNPQSEIRTPFEQPKNNDEKVMLHNKVKLLEDRLKTIDLERLVERQTLKRLEEERNHFKKLYEENLAFIEIGQKTMKLCEEKLQDKKGKQAPEFQEFTFMKREYQPIFVMGNQAPKKIRGPQKERGLLTEQAKQCSSKKNLNDIRCRSRSKSGGKTHEISSCSDLNKAIHARK